jgi:hypothetical protein
MKFDTEDFYEGLLNCFSFHIVALLNYDTMKAGRVPTCQPTTRCHNLDLHHNKGLKYIYTHCFLHMSKKAGCKGYHLLGCGDT